MAATQTVPFGVASASLAPVAASERIDLVDIVRGFALFGVLLANLVSLTDMTLTDARLSQLPTAPVDRIVRPLVAIFIDHKFITLFSFLFGLGFAIQLSRAEQRGRPAAALYARRVSVLALIGTLHILLLWFGDILLLYSLGGLMLLAVHRWNTRLLLVSAVALALFARVAVSVLPSALGQPRTAPATASMDADAEKERRLTVFDSHSYRSITSENRSVYYGFFITGGVAFFLLPQIFARFVFGLYVGRRGWASNSSALTPKLRRLLPWAIGAAGSCLAAEVYVSLLEERGVIQSGSLWSHVSIVIEEAGILLMSFTYLSALVLLFHRSATWRRRLGYLAPVGRMALTNYLTHSLLYLLLFTGIGLGLYGDAGPTLCVVLSMVIFAAQMAFSRWWLARYRFGPAEWLWRSLTYGRLQPMRTSLVKGAR